ncbi:MAG TPA: glycosyltransferase family 2 protein [Candidatus Saccharimonadales bacterium]|nr:glycosyltransferase family 2 protein [Candidatus Saccharimonadales bacterium]
MIERYSRTWEIVPGVLVWLTIIILIWLALFQPIAFAVIILCYAIYWLIKILMIATFLIAGFTRYRKERKIDWLKRLETDFSDHYPDLYHLVIVPTYKEDISILRHTLEALRTSNYDHQKIIAVVAFEGRDKLMAPEYARVLTHEYEHKFGHFLTTTHPSDIPGEVKGKGPNITWAGRRAKEFIDQKGYRYEDVIVTTLDADNRVNKDYLANLTWAYCNDPDPIHKSYQPIPMFFNNIWKVPLAVKLTTIGSTFWQMTQAMRPYYARNFSAQAQGLAALVKTDFWSVQTVVEDGHQYWRSYFAFKGNHYVVPIFVPVYMDAVQGDNLTDTLREQYLQRRRWYWGASDIPYVYSKSRGNKDIPFVHKWLQFVRLAESHYTLATQTFFLSLGWLPVVLHNDLRSTMIGYNFSILLNYAISSAWIGTVVTMLIASLLVPPRPGKTISYRLTLLKEWILAPLVLPISGMLFGSLPSIDSQTRMMLNKPFTVFNVTKKAAIPGGVVRESLN